MREWFILTNDSKPNGFLLLIMLYANRGRAPRIEKLSEEEAWKKIRVNNEDSM
jgi:hypothetical protein